MRYKHTVVSWDQLLTIRRRESSKDLESSRLFIAATCGKTAAFRDELMNFFFWAKWLPTDWFPTATDRVKLCWFDYKDLLNG